MELMNNLRPRIKTMAELQEEQKAEQRYNIRLGSAMAEMSQRQQEAQDRYTDAVIKAQRTPLPMEHIREERRREQGKTYNDISTERAQIIAEQYNQYKDYQEHVKAGRDRKNPTIEDAERVASSPTTDWLTSVFQSPDQRAQQTKQEMPAVTNKVTFSRYVDESEDRDRMKGMEGYHRLYSFMEEDEVDYYSYLLSKEGEAAADAWLESIMPELNRREMDPHAQRAAQTPWNKVTSFFNTAGEQLIGGVSGFVGDALEYLSTGKIDPYSANNYLQNKVRAERGAVQETIPGDWGKAAYGLATSAADMAASLLAGYSIGALPGAGGASGAGAVSTSPLLNTAKSALPANATKAIMAANAASQGTIAAKERGLSDSQALTLGLLSGGIEMITEHFSIEQLLSNPKSATQYILKNVVTEGAEEGASNILNTVADVIVAGDKSEWYTSIQRYMDGGMSQSDAFKAAFMDQVQSLNMDVLGGMVLGGIMSGGRAWGAAGKEVAAGATNTAKTGLQNVIAKTEPVMPNVDEQATGDVLAMKQPTGNALPQTEKTSIGTGATSNVVQSGTQETSGTQAYAGTKGVAPTYNWRADQVNEGNTSGVASLSEIVEDIKNQFGLAINKGKLESRKALGEFHRKSEGIRLKTANEVTVLCHEVGHWLDKQFGLSRLPGIQTAVDVFKTSTPNLAKGYKKSEMAGEAVAEFARRYMTDRTSAQQDYGPFYEQFADAVGGDTLQKLDAIGNKMNAYMTASEGEQMAAAIYSTEEARAMRRRSEGLKRRINRWSKTLYNRVFDEANPLKNLSQETYERYYHAKKANAVTEDGLLSGDRFVGFNRERAPMRDVNGNVMTDESGNPIYEKSLAQVLEPLVTKSGKQNKDIFNDFNTYLVDRHGMELPGIKVFANPDLDNPSAMRREADRLEKKYPQFREVAEDLYRWQRNLLYTWGVETGVISLDTFNALGEKYKAYVPLQRHIDPTSGEAKKSSGQPIKSIHGSGLDIICPTDSIAVNAQKLVSLAMKNNVYQLAAKAAEDTDGAAIYMERVRPDMVQSRVSVETVVNALENAELLDEDGRLDFLDSLTDAYGDTISQWGVSRQQSPDIVTVMQGGKPTYYRVNDQQLLNALVDLGPSATKTIADVMAAVNRPFKTLTTGVNFLWGLFKNVTADVQGGFINSRENNPFKYTGQYLAAVWDVLARTENYKAWRAAGGGYSAYIGQNTKKLSSISAALFNTDGNIIKSKLKHFIELLESIGNALDAPPRLAEAKRAQKSGESWMDAVFAGDEATTNFSRGGSWAKQVDKFAPYTNAALQGIWRMGNQFKNHPKESIGKFVVSSLILSALVHGINRLTGSEEEYKKLSTRTKNNYYCFHKGDGKFIKISKGRNYSVLESLMERAWELAVEENPDAFYEFDDYILTTFNPIGDNPLFSLASDWRANETFAGAPIVPAGIDDLAEEEQFDQTTSYVARYLGNLLGLSPMKLDYAMDQLFGVVGDVVTSISPEGNVLESVAGRYPTADNAYSNDALSILYKERKELGERNKSTLNPDPGAAYDYSAYDSFLSTVSSINKYGKTHADEERACKILTRDEALQFREEFVQDEELVALYEKTGENEVFPFRAFETEFSFDGEKYSIHPTDVVQMMHDYNDAIAFAYEDILDSNLSDDEKVKALKKSKDLLFESVKEKYAAISLGEGDAKAPVETNTLGISDGDYAYFKSKIAEFESDEDENGNPINGSKKEKVCAFIDTFCDEQGFGKEVKYRLYEACGYSESAVVDTPWWQRSDYKENWFDDVWKKE